MDKLSKIYGFTSLLFFLVLAVSPLKNNHTDWQKIQKEYNQMIQEMPQRIKPIPIRLKQIWAKELNRVDRCVTCHLGVENKKLALAPEPYRTHPKIPHDINKFGCSICHGGQGLATRYTDAHLASEFWDQPVLPTRYLQSACGQCHVDGGLKETKILDTGRKLVQQLNCVACHELPAFQKQFAPHLDGVGKKIISRNWLVRWLKNPASIQPKTKMPNFFLPDEEVEILADFLMSFQSFPEHIELEPLPKFYLEQKENDAFINLGKTRFREARCISCHSVEGKGGKLATDLGKIASKVSEVWLYNYLKDPRRLQPGVEMPKFGFTKREIAAITAYMNSEFVDWDMAEEEEQPSPPIPNFYEKGLALFNQYNCGGCHQLSATNVIQNKGPDLTFIGSKKIYQIDFANSNIPRTLYDYINAKLKEPRIFGQNVRMPLFSLSDEDRDAITTFLLSLRNEALPEEFIVHKQKEPEFQPQGEVGRIFHKYSCLKCHTVFGSGGTIAPNLSIVGSQLQRDWTRKYFTIPYSLRPLQEERMPNLFISAQEIEVLLQYFYTVLLSDSVSTTFGWRSSPQSVERGKALFQEKYGCQSCHIVQGKGGYLGPRLDGVGARLQPGWILHWLIDPQKYKPETIEPRTGMTLSEARDITSYLMSL